MINKNNSDSNNTNNTNKNTYHHHHNKYSLQGHGNVDGMHPIHIGECWRRRDPQHDGRARAQPLLLATALQEFPIAVIITNSDESNT